MWNIRNWKLIYIFHFGGGGGGSLCFSVLFFLPFFFICVCRNCSANNKYWKVRWIFIGKAIAMSTHAVYTMSFIYKIYDNVKLMCEGKRVENIKCNFVQFV